MALVAGFDGSFHHITLDGGFLDPTLPSGYAPFGVQNIGGTIFIAYAVRSASGGEVVPGKGSGRVAAFDTEGHFLRVVASGGAAERAVGNGARSQELWHAWAVTCLSPVRATGRSTRTAGPAGGTCTTAPSRHPGGNRF